MDTVNIETLRALGQISPEVLQALQAVPAEVLEALARVRPEALHTLGEAPSEIPEAQCPKPQEARTSVPVTPGMASGVESPGTRSVRDDIEGLQLAIRCLGEALEGTDVNVVGTIGKFRNKRTHQGWRNIRIDSGGGGVSRLLATPDYKVAQVLSVLGSEVRLAMLRSLLESPKSASELVAALRLGTTGQAYHHLRELEKAGYVEQREGRYHFVGGMTRVYLTALLLAADAGAEAGEDAEPGTA